MNRWLAALFSLPFMTACASASAPLRVACVGDSITYGDKLADRETQSYPAVLAQLAGGRFLTGNFGVNGATALDIASTQACGSGRVTSPTPRLTSVSISTAVWIVMCRQPAIFAPASGFDAPCFARSDISPGISFSASAISLRPQSASPMSATLKSGSCLIG